MVKVADKPAEEGRYAMPLAEYLHRRAHVSKGSWNRPIDKRYASKESLQNDDFGRAGCRNGEGAFHPLRGGHCLYCGLTRSQIVDRQKQSDKLKEERQ